MCYNVGNMRQFFQSTATLIGMIVGVGIFGVPYVVSQVGFGLGLFWILGVGLLVLGVHLFYGEVVALTPGRHRLPGYVGRYLGPHFKHIMATSEVVGYWGAQVAYIIVGGHFLALLFNGNGSFLFSTAIFVFVALVSLFGIRVLGRVELAMTVLLLLVIVLIVSFGAPYVSKPNLAGLNWPLWSLPFGVILFSLTGVSAIPEMFDIAGRARTRFMRAVALGSLVPVLITALFTWVVVGITGPETTEAALDGLKAFLPSGVMKLGILFGFLAVITSYMVLALYLKELFAYDYRVKEFPAWLVGVCVPFFLFLAGARDFIKVIDLTGGIFTAFVGVMIPLTAIAVMRKRMRLPRSNWRIILAGVIALIFAAIVLHKIGGLFL